MHKPSNCVKCGGSMVEGFIVDATYGANAVSNWASGQPVKSFWTGLKIDRADKFETRTYRCNRCGYLESYAI